MDCPYCDHPKTHKHGKTSKGSQRYKCAHCTRTFVETFDTLYYWRQVSADEVESILQLQAEGSRLRGISRINKRAYNTVVSIVHNDPVVATLASATNSGLNYGIPISTFINQAAANGIYLNFDVSRNAAQPLGAPIADARNADPVSPVDRIDDVSNGLSSIVDLIGVVDGVIDGICGLFGC